MKETVKALSMLETASQQKAGLPSFTQLRERNNKLIEYNQEMERKRFATPLNTGTQEIETVETKGNNVMDGVDPRLN